MSATASPLDLLQHWMQDALIHPPGTGAAAIDDVFLPSPRLSAADRLAIYQRSYRTRLLRCMQEQYPALAHALGADLFADFAAQYLRDRPSRSYTLHDLGAAFPGWLQDNRPDRDRAPAEREDWIDFMVDLAGFERALFALFDAPGHEGDSFASRDTPDELLLLQPCFALFACRYPVAGYYHAVRLQQAPVFPPRGDAWYALLRKDYLTRTCPLRWTQYVFLAALRSGEDVAGGLARVAAASGRQTSDVATAWRGTDSSRSTWIDSGFFVSTSAAG